VKLIGGQRTVVDGRPLGGASVPNTKQLYFLIRSQQSRAIFGSLSRARNVGELFQDQDYIDRLKLLFGQDAERLLAVDGQTFKEQFHDGLKKRGLFDLFALATGVRDDARTLEDDLRRHGIRIRVNNVLTSFRDHLDEMWTTQRKENLAFISLTVLPVLNAYLDGCCRVGLWESTQVQGTPSKPSRKYPANVALVIWLLAR
jgi:hypothetical protein